MTPENVQPVLADAKLRALIASALSELEAKTAGLDALLHFEEAEWNVDQDAGTITFTRPDGLRAVAPVQIVGTYNTTDGTWLWGWDHPSVEAALARDAALVRQFGHERDIEPLALHKIACTESDCWEFTALACKLAGAQGAYRGAAGTVLVFMTFGHLKMSPAR